MGFVPCDTDIGVLNMTLVNGNINPRSYVGGGVLTFHEVEVPRGFVGVGSTAGAFIVVKGRRLWFSLIVGYLL